MKTKSITKLACMMPQYQDEQLTEITGWLKAKGTKPMTNREKEAFADGISRGWHGAVSMIQLHGLK